MLSVKSREGQDLKINLADNVGVSAAKAITSLPRTENPNLKTVISHHHRLKPEPGALTPADVEKALSDAGLPVKVLNPELSRVYELTK